MMRRKSAENDIPLSVRVNFGANSETGNEEEEEFLKPTSAGNEEDDDYLKPRTHPTNKTEESNPEDEYLKPTFGHFERIDSRDLSPPTELPPAIPMQSYSPLKLS